eukprot:CAMPEP_0113551314 /NCGR_PEP_ID=MMETSP0015_2-20120614/14458_1 /TAXON_ID=2838 /ORGANISM="Odontella" /LENGTH=139 /DNA_ID=CAMNT_0000452197 /DNA_START=192 /DNA_END=608 /DNA_ORIENTATION=- /assembly_acc=CAM_ASM_000160
MVKARAFIGFSFLPSVCLAFPQATTFGARSGQIEGACSNVPSLCPDVRRRGRGKVVLCQSRVEVKSPTPDEAAEMGTRDWPQQLKRGSWSENIGGGKSAVRYVLDGTGTVESFSDDGQLKSQVGPGSLVEATGPIVLEW